MIRVCIISHAYIDPFQCGKLIHLGDNPDVDLTVITPRRGVEYGNQAITIESSVTNYEHVGTPTILTGKLNTFVYRNLGTILRQHQPDIVQIEEEYWSNAAFSALRATKKHSPRSKIVLQTCENLYHNWKQEATTTYQHIRYRLFDHIQQTVFQGVDAIFDQEWYITGKSLTALTQHGYTGKRYAIPQLGVDPERFHVDRQPTTTPLRITFLGRLVDEKGVDTAIAAVNKMPKSIAHLKIVGNGPLRDRVAQMAKQTPNSNITIAPAISPEDVPELLASTDILLVPSKTTPDWIEQFGRVLVEGMAAGAIVLGSSSGSIQHILPKESLFEETDTQQIAKKIAYFAENSDARNKIRNKQKTILEKYTNETIAKQTINAYQQLIQTS